MKILKLIIMACFCINVTLQAQSVDSNIVNKESPLKVNVEQISDNDVDDNQLNNTPQDDIEKEFLVQKIDSLEKELSFVKLLNELNVFRLELQVNINNLDIKSNTISLHINSKMFLRVIYNTYKENYDASEDMVQMYQSNVELNKMNCYLQIWKYNYSENQKSVLEGTIKVIDQSYIKLKLSLDYYKTCLDIYRDNL